jgi:hypothetical protein
MVVFLIIEVLYTSVPFAEGKQLAHCSAAISLNLSKLG